MHFKGKQCCLAEINGKLEMLLQGTAEVVFSRRQDAVAGVKRFNNVQLDGKPMKIEIVGTNIVAPTAPFPNGAFAFGDANRVPRRYALLLTKMLLNWNKILFEILYSAI